MICFRLNSDGKGICGCSQESERFLSHTAFCIKARKGLRWVCLDRLQLRTSSRYIFRQGDEGDGLYVIASGTVIVHKGRTKPKKSEDDKILATLGTGDGLKKSACTSSKTIMHFSTFFRNER